MEMPTASLVMSQNVHFIILSRVLTGQKYHLLPPPPPPWNNVCMQCGDLSLHGWMVHFSKGRCLGWDLENFVTDKKYRQVLQRSLISV